MLTFSIIYNFFVGSSTINIYDIKTRLFTNKNKCTLRILRLSLSLISEIITFRTTYKQGYM